MFLQCLSSPRTLPDIDLDEIPFNRFPNESSEVTEIANECLHILVTDEKGNDWKWNLEEYRQRVAASRFSHQLLKMEEAKLIKYTPINTLRVPTRVEATLFKIRLEAKKEERANALNAKKNVISSPFLIQTIHSKDFETQFQNKEAIEEITFGQSVFVYTDPSLKIAHKAVVTRGVGPYLALGVVGRDNEGMLLASGLGHFTEKTVEKFCNGDRKESNDIKLLLDDVFKHASRVAIFIIGCYNSKYLLPLDQAINALYKPEKFEAVLNPWKLPDSLSEREDALYLKQYLNELGCNLKIGITDKGYIYIASNDGKEVLNLYENEFYEWKKLKGFIKINSSGTQKNSVTAESNLKKGFILQSAQEIWKNRAAICSRVNNYENIEYMNKVCDHYGMCLDDLLAFPEADSLWFISDRIRRVLLFYIKDRKSKNCTIENLTFYNEVEKRLQIFSAKAVIECIKKTSLVDQNVIKTFILDKFPGSIEQFNELDEVKNWLKRDAGKNPDIVEPRP